MKTGTAVRLQVNIDHAATVRQARRAPYPDPVEIARLSEQAGASGITVHLRGDRRHIQDDDVHRLRAAVRGRLNLEMAATAEMIAIARATRPHQVSLVPETPEEITTEGGLDLLHRFDIVSSAANELRSEGIEVSLFLDPDPRQIERAAELRAHVHGFEINTDRYARAALGTDAAAIARELEAVREAARLGGSLGLEVYAGHGLTAANVAAIAAVPEIEELNIGHWLIARALTLGIEGAVREMLAAMGQARRPGATRGGGAS